MVLFYILITLSFICISLAAICNAKMDTVDDHYSTSVYADKPFQWFDPNRSWINKNPPNSISVLVEMYQDSYLPLVAQWIAKLKKGWAPVSDFWHFEKAKMICWLILGATLSFAAGVAFSHHGWGVVAIVVTVFYISKGILWNLIFNYYYDHKLKKK